MAITWKCGCYCNLFSYLPRGWYFLFGPITLFRIQILLTSIKMRRGRKPSIKTSLQCTKIAAAVEKASAKWHSSHFQMRRFDLNSSVTLITTSEAKSFKKKKRPLTYILLKTSGKISPFCRKTPCLLHNYVIMYNSHVAAAGNIQNSTARRGATAHCVWKSAKGRHNKHAEHLE